MLKRTLTLRFNSTIRIVPIKDILYIEKYGRKSLVHTEKEEYIYYAKFDDILPDLDGRFTNCHRSYILNMDRIVFMGKMRIKMDDSSELIFGRSTFLRLKKEMESYAVWKRRLQKELDIRMNARLQDNMP